LRLGQKKYKKKIAVIGAGSWGTALAITFAHNHNVSLWDHNKERAIIMEKERRNQQALPLAKFPDRLKVSNDLEKTLDGARVITFAVPSHVLADVVKLVSPYLTKKQYLVSVVKGIQEETLLRMSDVIKNNAANYKGIVVLTGPTHAEEVANMIPSAIVAASSPLKHAKAIQKYFMTPFFRIYTNPDIIGVEVGGAMKNIIAIAAGISDGLNYGDNTKAALMTRGLAEMKRLGMKMGGKSKTFSGLSGMGDLIATCMSKFSRNRKVGMALGHGRSLDDILKDLHQVAEGVINTRNAMALSKKYDVELPITSAIYSVLYENRPAKDLGHLLMTRSAKKEFY